MFKTLFELVVFINGWDDEAVTKSRRLFWDILNNIVKIHQKKRLNET